MRMGGHIGIVVVCLILVALGPEFSPHDPSLSTQPHEALQWITSRLTNLPSLFHESRSLIFPFGKSMENVLENGDLHIGRGRE